MDTTQKQLKLLILIPCESSILYDSAMSIINLFLYLKREEIDFQFYSISGSAHAFARNTLFKKAYEHASKEEFSHILCIDSDHVFLPEEVIKLISLKEEFGCDILGAGYLTKQNPINLVALKATQYSEKIPTLPIRYVMLSVFDINKVYEVDAIGFGMVVMNIDILKKMVEHYGTTDLCEFPYREGIVIGEDVTFCEKAKAIGYKVFVTTAIILGHVTTGIMNVDYAKKLYDRDFSIPSSMIIKKNNDEIEGWLTKEEGDELERLAKENQSGNIVEIGSWKGKSTIRLAKGSMEGKKNMVFAVDPHTGSPEHKRNGEEINTYPEFETNIKKSGVENYVVPVVSTSEETAVTFNAPVGLIFIDGAHEYESVRKDFEMWYDKVIIGGIIAFHDNDWPGIRRLLKELEGSQTKYKLKNKMVISTITHYTKGE